MPPRVYISSVIAISARPRAGIVLALLLQLATTDRISQAELKELVAANAVAIVDTRAEPEFARGHIPRAVSLTEADLAAKTPRAERALAVLRRAKTPVVVYCACPAEITSLRMVQALSEHGIAGARALTGGWVEWFNAGNPVEPAK
jgi:rhodanese-related sulfurtransferase